MLCNSRSFGGLLSKYTRLLYRTRHVSANIATFCWKGFLLAETENARNNQLDKYNDSDLPSTEGSGSGFREYSSGDKQDDLIGTDLKLIFFYTQSKFVRSSKTEKISWMAPKHLVKKTRNQHENREENRQKDLRNTIYLVETQKVVANSKPVLSKRKKVVDLSCIFQIQR